MRQRDGNPPRLSDKAGGVERKERCDDLSECVRAVCACERARTPRDPDNTRTRRGRESKGCEGHTCSLGRGREAPTHRARLSLSLSPFANSFASFLPASLSLPPKPPNPLNHGDRHHQGPGSAQHRGLRQDLRPVRLEGGEEESCSSSSLSHAQGSGEVSGESVLATPLFPPLPPRAAASHHPCLPAPTPTG